MIIGFTGPAGSGKDTAADHLVTRHDFTKVSWATPLKAALAAMGFPEPADRALKEVPIPGFNFSWRQAAQALGTEWGRALDPDIWVKIVGEQLRASPERLWVISDVRFENEAAMIRSLGGVVIHLHGRRADLGGAEAHASEKGVKGSDADWNIENAGVDLQQFKQVVSVLCLDLVRDNALKGSK
jgi:hypothetical protein